MIAIGDVTELQDIADPRNAVSVVKGKLKFEWPSLMLFRSDNFACKKLTPEYIDNPVSKPQTLEWCPEDRLGSLPEEWNHCVPYDDPGQAKIIHYTAGIPCWPETKECEHSAAWWEEFRHANSTVEWKDLMANSVHATPEVMGKLKATA